MWRKQAFRINILTLFSTDFFLFGPQSPVPGNLKFACLTIKRHTGGQDQFLCCMLIGIFAAPTILSQMNPICKQVCGCGVLYHWGQLLFNYHTSHTWTKTSYMTYTNFPTNPSFLLYLITFISVYHILISWMYLSKHWKL